MDEKRHEDIILLPSPAHNKVLHAYEKVTTLNKVAK